ncbi:MAG: ABC transporter permease [Oscillospiraceae bacterium]|nr:ABC transporter permease [Oscillospiraceae bacterium]
MRLWTFAKRCGKEIYRDPINVLFGLGFPVALLLLMTMLQQRIPVALFEIQRLAPGMCVFGLSFLTLFSATLVARDRESAFLQRLYTTPLKAWEFLLGYSLPFFPLALGQAVVCYGVAFALGLPLSWGILRGLLGLLPLSLFYIALGLLCGSGLGVKQVGGLCGALLTNVSAWLSGLWFDLELMGDGFGKLARALPFYHGFSLELSALSGATGEAWSHLIPVLLYGCLTAVTAVLLFLGQMRKQ